MHLRKAVRATWLVLQEQNPLPSDEVLMTAHCQKIRSHAAAHSSTHIPYAAATTVQGASSVLAAADQPHLDVLLRLQHLPLQQLLGQRFQLGTHQHVGHVL